MNGFSKKITVISVVAILGALSAAYFFLWRGKSTPTEGGPMVSTRQQLTNQKTKQDIPAKVAKSMQVRVKDNQARANVVSGLEDEEFASLTPELRKIMTDLQVALDNDDFKTVSSLCETILKIQRERGEAAVPAEVRAKAVEALGLFLPESLAELMGFMADSDPEVLESVIDQLDTVLNDTTIGDVDLSPILSSIAKVLVDEDALDSLALTIEANMRHSVMIATYKNILETGTEPAKARIRESIKEQIIEDEDFILPTNDKQLSQMLDEWLIENPDDEDDDEFYKGD